MIGTPLDIAYAHGDDPRAAMSSSLLSSFLTTLPPLAWGMNSNLKRVPSIVVSYHPNAAPTRMGWDSLKYPTRTITVAGGTTRAWDRAVRPRSKAAWSSAVGASR